MVILLARLEGLVDGPHQLVDGLEVLEYVRKESIAVCPLQVCVLFAELSVDLLEVMKERDLLDALRNDISFSLFGLDLSQPLSCVKILQS